MFLGNMDNFLFLAETQLLAYPLYSMTFLHLAECVPIFHAVHLSRHTYHYSSPQWNFFVFHKFSLDLRHQLIRFYCTRFNNTFTPFAHVQQWKSTDCTLCVVVDHLSAHNWWAVEKKHILSFSVYLYVRHTTCRAELMKFFHFVKMWLNPGKTDLQLKIILYLSI